MCLIEPVSLADRLMKKRERESARVCDVCVCSTAGDAIYDDD